ncbi:MAG: type II secretion system F family protein [Candidatus Marsarchaeota archaeon]|nr:type II secretion system F family protein [Candidatus Marsarchaeota archaeon]
MITSVPLLPLPPKAVRSLATGFYPIAMLVEKLLPGMERDLEEAPSALNARQYIGGALLAFTLYLAAFGIVLAGIAGRSGLLSSSEGRVGVFALSLAFSFSIFLYILLIPRWLAGKKRALIERDLLFAARHLMIQTSAGVPLFDAIVSISEEYDDEALNYGEIAREFGRIVRNVRGGQDLTEALEGSAQRSPSPYYQRVAWMLANANKAGANTGHVLRDVVEFLAGEQRIAIRNYGSQLNPLAVLYMLACVIAPTMGVIFLAIASTLVDIPLNELTFGAILAGLALVQIMFIGLIKSRRPTVSI